MSAAFAVATEARAEMPPEVRRKIALFLAAGMTGTITLLVKEGRVLSYELTEKARVGAERLDGARVSGQDSADG